MAAVFHFQAADVGHTARVQEFQRDVTADIGNCIRRHITTGDAVGLSKPTYYELRRIVAEWLSLHPSAIVVVGSCRTGFTIKPHKRYSPFTSASDIDIAIVSEHWFDRFWDDIFMATQPNRDWVLTTREGKLLGRDLFNGWLTPEKLPPLPGVEHGLRVGGVVCKPDAFAGRRPPQDSGARLPQLVAARAVSVSLRPAMSSCNHRGETMNDVQGAVRLGDLLAAVAASRLIPKPAFQRQLVWTNKDKEFLIDSVQKDMPFPEIFVAAAPRQHGRTDRQQLLVDGQQRISTLMDYVSPSPKVLHKTIRRFVDLSPEERDKFLDYKVAVRDLGTKTDSEIRDIFHRINKTNYILKSMEVFNALFNGQYIQYCTQLARQDFFTPQGLYRGLPTTDARPHVLRDAGDHAPGWRVLQAG